MVSGKVTVKNPTGLHLRPAGRDVVRAEEHRLRAGTRPRARKELLRLRLAEREVHAFPLRAQLRRELQRRVALLGEHPPHVHALLRGGRAFRSSVTTTSPNPSPTAVAGSPPIVVSRLS